MLPIYSLSSFKEVNAGFNSLNQTPNTDNLTITTIENYNPGFNYLIPPTSQINTCVLNVSAIDNASATLNVGPNASMILVGNASTLIRMYGSITTINAPNQIMNIGLNSTIIHLGNISSQSASIHYLHSVSSNLIGSTNISGELKLAGSVGKSGQVLTCEDGNAVWSNSTIGQVVLTQGETNGSLEVSSSWSYGANSKESNSSMGQIIPFSGFLVGWGHSINASSDSVVVTQIVLNDKPQNVYSIINFSNKASYSGKWSNSSTSQINTSLLLPKTMAQGGNVIKHSVVSFSGTPLNTHSRFSMVFMMNENLYE